MAETQSAQLWIKVDLPGSGQIGPGKVELLRQIRQRSSIAAAARSMHMSYRRAWLLVNELNHLLAEPMVQTRIGGRSHGGARLTELGEKVVASYDRILRQSHSACQVLLKDLGKLPASRGSSKA
jgi:molybdate transport system regulatory protein